MVRGFRAVLVAGPGTAVVVDGPGEKRAMAFGRRRPLKRFSEHTARRVPRRAGNSIDESINISPSRLTNSYFFFLLVARC